VSKAFVREDDAAAEEPEAEEPRFGPAPRYITPQGRARSTGCGASSARA
jgi:hypothetical protein